MPNNYQRLSSFLVSLGGAGGGAATVPGGSAASPGIALGQDIGLSSSAAGKFGLGIAGTDIITLDNADPSSGATVFQLQNGSYAGGVSPLLRLGTGKSTSAVGAALLATADGVLGVRTGEGGSAASLTARDLAASATNPSTGDAIRAQGDISINTLTGRLRFLTQANIAATADGFLKLTNSDDTTFTFLSLGPNTTAFPGIMRNGTGVRFRLGNNTGDINVSGAGFTTNVTSALSAPQFTHSNTASAGLHINGSTGVPSLTFSSTQYFQVTSTAFNFVGPIGIAGARYSTTALTAGANTAFVGTSRTQYHNTGLAAPATLTLPTPAAGLSYSVACIVAQTITVTTPSGLIYLAGTTAAASKSTSAIGSTGLFVCHDGANWIATATGTWA